MNKRKLLKQKMAALQKQYDELALEEQKKAGALVLSLYDKGELKDDNLRQQIARLIGDVEPKPDKDKSLDAGSDLHNKVV
jgi:hypothetical protein